MEFPSPVEVMEARLIDRRRNLEAAEFKCSGNTVEVPFEGGSAVLLLKFKQEQAGGGEKSPE